MDIKKPKKIKGGFFIEPRIPLMRKILQRHDKIDIYIKN
jgi:hypothetical protein